MEEAIPWEAVWNRLPDPSRFTIAIYFALGFGIIRYLLENIIYKVIHLHFFHFHFFFILHCIQCIIQSLFFPAIGLFIAQLRKCQIEKERCDTIKIYKMHRINVEINILWHHASMGYFNYKARTLVLEY